MTDGAIKEGEYHPAANSAMAYVESMMASGRISIWIESLASTAMSGNRLAEICYETFRRLQEGEPVSDRYVLGLAWTLKELEEGHDRHIQAQNKGPL